MVNQEDITIPLAMPADEALAFSQLLKRLGYTDCERLADRKSYYGKRCERDVMWCSVQSVQRQLAQAGFAPR
jgi:hypothetical protein